MFDSKIHRLEAVHSWAWLWFFHFPLGLIPVQSVGKQLRSLLCNSIVVLVFKDLVKVSIDTDRQMWRYMKFLNHKGRCLGHALVQTCCNQKHITLFNSMESVLNLWISLLWQVLLEIWGNFAVPRKIKSQEFVPLHTTSEWFLGWRCILLDDCAYT